MLGLFLKELGKPAGGEQALRQALDLNRLRHSSETSSSEVELALLLQTIGKRREATELFRKASAGTDARAAALGYENLARLDPVNAASYYEKAAAAERIAWGKTSPRVATQLSNQALALKAEAGKTREVLLRQALEIQEAAFGRSHYQTAATLSNLASVLQSLGKLDEAEKLSREAFSIFSQRLPHTLELAAVCANLADILNRKGDGSGAIGFLRLAIANDEAGGGADSVETAADLAGLARLLQQSDDSSEAGALFRRALSIYESKLGADSVPAREVRRSLGGAIH